MFLYFFWEGELTSFLESVSRSLEFLSRLDATESLLNNVEVSNLQNQSFLKPCENIGLEFREPKKPERNSLPIDFFYGK